jgi:hypothetical protein
MAVRIIEAIKRIKPECKLLWMESFRKDGGNSWRLISLLYIISHLSEDSSLTNYAAQIPQGLTLNCSQPSSVSIRLYNYKDLNLQSL